MTVSHVSIPAERRKSMSVMSPTAALVTWSARELIVVELLSKAITSCPKEESSVAMVLSKDSQTEDPNNLCFHIKSFQNIVNE